MQSVFVCTAIRGAVVALGAMGVAVSSAQSLPPQGKEVPSSNALKEVTITGNPLGASDLLVPAVALEAGELASRSRSTLGETLNGTPGVSSSYFGPNASRPIIRGLDGDRIRILNNSGATLDASALSYDHAVPLEPMTIERIEVLRGPGALQFGGSAVGGVVNVIDNRIPKEPLGGVTGKVDAGAATGTGERSLASMVEAGDDRIAVHVDAFDRRTGDVRVPISLPCTRPGSVQSARRICNSAADSQGGAAGATLFFDQGYLGASAATYTSRYGTVAEDNVTIGMRSNRYALEGEWRQPLAGWRSLKGQFSHTDYQHTEFEAGQAGTVFKNQGNDLRLEARHERWMGLDGMVGWQSESGRFVADGEEAFAPSSRTRSHAVFVYEELPTAWGKWTLGGRTEQVRVGSLGGSDPGVTRFEVGERRFNPHSAAAGALVKLQPEWQLTSHLAYTERAPKDYELFANGPHLATAAWEVGDAALRKEQSTNVDLGLGWRRGPHQAQVSVFTTRFRNFIGLVPTGSQIGLDGARNPASGDGFAEYRYGGVRARFSGLEANGNVRLWGAGGLWQGQVGHLDLNWRGDMVRATNLDTGEPLPRIAPLRLGASLLWSAGPWSLKGGFDHMAAQSRVPSGTRATGAYTLWNAMASYRVTVPVAGHNTQLNWYVRLDNATDRLAYSATSILTTTAFPKAPLPGRSLKIGVQATF